MDSPANARIARLSTQLYAIDQLLATVATNLALIRVQLTQATTTLTTAEQQRVALHWRLVEQADGYVARQCAWCGAHLGIMWAEQTYINRISHGICTACAMRVFGEVLAEE